MDHTMIDDKWQLHEWLTCQCKLNPRARARSIIVSGWMKENVHVHNQIIFKTRKELALFLLKYADCCQHFKYSSYIDDYQQQIFTWNVVSRRIPTRQYSEGPKADHDQ